MQSFNEKKPFLATLLAIGLLLLSSCSKDRNDPPPPVNPEENPLALYLKNSGFDQKSTNFINSGTYEFGYSFQSKVKGKIKAITFKIPDNATNIRVTIWDVATKSPLRTIIIPNAVAGTEVTQSIDPLEVSVGTGYLLTYNGADWYKREKTDGSDTSYPVEAGNILITGYLWGTASTATQTYPINALSKNYYAGDLSFVFQQTD